MHWASTEGAAEADPDGALLGLADGAADTDGATEADAAAEAEAEAEGAADAALGTVVGPTVAPPDELHAPRASSDATASAANRVIRANAPDLRDRVNGAECSRAGRRRIRMGSWA
jgi:hypothetical protein